MNQPDYLSENLVLETPSVTSLRTRPSVAIQGVHGAFHELAARNYFVEQKIEVAPAETFADLIRMTESSEVDTAVMAIENTIAGSILSNYNLLNNSDLEISGEIFLRIKQNLMALKGQRIEDLREVHSHPIALQQCVEFFQQYPHIRLVEATDTALVAKKIKEENLTDIGAIGSTLAAEIYGMDLLAEEIETYKKNYTRFLVLHRSEHRPISEQQSTFDKVSLVFTTSHEVGSLYRVLECFAKNGCNLTKIQSAPIMDKPWEYSFFTDIIISSPAAYAKAIQDIGHLVGELRILGEYQSGKYVE